jgi:hypothetical protein
VSDVIVDIDQNFGWEIRSSVGSDSDPDLHQTDVRWFINVLNRVLSENYVLRQELAQLRSNKDGVGLYEIAVAAPPASQESPVDLLETSDSRQIFNTPSDQRTEPTGYEVPPAEGELERTNRGSIRSDLRTVTWEEHEKVVHQLEGLGHELRNLKSEFRTARWKAQPDENSSVDSMRSVSFPRFQPIRMGRQDLTFEADPHPGMWMRLREPWFYLPLIWATILGTLALIVAFIFL